MHIDFNFKHPEKLSIDKLASYVIKVKEPSVFRTKELYLPLTENSFKNNGPRPLPS